MEVRKIKGLLCDIYGVLISAVRETRDAGPSVIPGSIEAVRRWKCSGLPVRFVTNTSSMSREHFAHMLQTVMNNLH